MLKFVKFCGWIWNKSHQPPQTHSCKFNSLRYQVNSCAVYVPPLR